ncbi:hypothetical protein [Caldithrix abyssi]|uniref:hypothetical protein n=1 Tax=Caldithrix abyssi TaxID=187145 RepID=UPI0012378D2B|nr:hypothetical protein [Caldithrix abyssi]
MVEWLNGRQPGIPNSDLAGKAPVHVFVGAKDFHHYFFIGHVLFESDFFPALHCSGNPSPLQVRSFFFYSD